MSGEILTGLLLASGLAAGAILFFMLGYVAGHIWGAGGRPDQPGGCDVTRDEILRELKAACDKYLLSGQIAAELTPTVARLIDEAVTRRRVARDKAVEATRDAVAEALKGELRRHGWDAETLAVADDVVEALAPCVAASLHASRNVGLAAAGAGAEWRKCPGCHRSWPHPSAASHLHCPDCRVARVAGFRDEGPTRPGLVAGAFAKAADDIDAELGVIADVARDLELLTPPARDRALSYLLNRFVNVTPGES